MKERRSVGVTVVLQRVVSNIQTVVQVNKRAGKYARLVFNISANLLP